jgi:Fe-S-cluster containining protein
MSKNSVTVAASLLRCQYVLPNELLAYLSEEKLTGVTIDRKAFGLPYWQAEKHISLEFNGQGVYDDRDALSRVCASCGQCCTDLPSHQIAIYMSAHEYASAVSAKHSVQVAGEVWVRGRGKLLRFFVLATRSNGDCAMLGEQGCTLGDLKPLWCKLFYCEKFYGGAYTFEKTAPIPPLPSQRS